MAEYHVKVSPDGVINAGTMDKNGKLNRKSDVTIEALEAVRDHLLIKTVNEDKAMAFAWQYPNGKTLILKLEEQENEKVKEEDEE